MNRRNFLQSTTSALAAGIVANAGLGTSNVFAFEDEKRKTDFQNWANVRAEFDRLSTEHIHLSSFFLVSHPRIVRETIDNYRRGIDDNPFLFVEQNIFEMPGKIQAAVAEYVGGKPEEIAVTNSTTMGLSHVYQGLPISGGQEILTTTHDHFVHHESIRLAAERAGATMKKISLFDDFNSVSKEEIVSRIKKAITSKTRAVGVTWVHSSSGVKLPVRAIADAIAEANRNRREPERIYLVVDGVHGFGVEDETIAEMGADFFIAGTHKWIFGPRGTGIIWAKAENWKTLRLIFPGVTFETFSAWITDTPVKSPVQASWVGQGGFHAFEYEWALPAAFEFHKQIGRKRIADRIHTLNDQCKEGLAKMPHVKLYTPRGSELSSGLICFDVKGMKSEEVVKRLLEKQIIASTAPYRNPYVRLAPSLLNSPEEIETTLRQIKILA